MICDNYTDTCYIYIMQIQKSAVDVHFGTCELRAAWKSSEEELKDLDHTLEIYGISVNSVKIIIEDEETEKGTFLTILDQSSPVN